MSVSVVVAVLTVLLGFAVTEGQIGTTVETEEVGWDVEERLTSLDQFDPGEVCLPPDVSDCSSLLWRNDSCQCGAKVRDIVLCQNNKKDIGILQCYCLYNESNEYYVGGCFYGCFIGNHRGYTKLYHPYTNNDDITKMCRNWNRTGPLCGSCDLNYSVGAYSFSLKCVECDFHWTNIVRYIGIAYGPLTLFFLLIVVFTVSIHSAPLHGYIFVAQMIATSFSLRILTAMNEDLPNKPKQLQINSVGLAATVYGVWNLDFFRFVYPHYCLHPSLSTLGTFSLDYGIAAYPFVIMLITYTLVIQHSKGCRLLVLIWRPFHKFFGRFRENLDIRTSLVDAFGTFFSLSYVKFLSTTVDLLASTNTWGVDGEMLSTHVYYDANLEFMKRTHIYYAILALSCFTVFNVLPLVLLLLYPRRFFQKRLSLSARRFLHPLMDTLLGIYRDGTDGGADCRYFVVVYPIARIALFAMQLMTQDSLVFLLITIVITITAILVAVIKPYKSRVYNTVDTILLGILALVYASLTAFFFATYLYSPGLKFSRVLLIIFISLPFLYTCGLMVYWCWIVCKLKHKLLRMSQFVVEMSETIYYFITEGLKKRREMQSFPSLSETTLLIPHTD